MEAVMNGAKTFAPMKTASAVIAFYYKIYFFNHELTRNRRRLAWCGARRRYASV